ALSRRKNLTSVRLQNLLTLSLKMHLPKHAMPAHRLDCQQLQMIRVFVLMRSMGRLGFYLHAMPLLSWLIIRSIPQCEPNYSIWMQMRPIIRCYYIKCRVSNNDALVLSLHWYTSDTPMTHCH